MYIQAKRDNDLLEKAEKTINEVCMTAEQRDTLNKLCKNYRLSTYENHGDRHEFYRTIVDDMVNDMCFEDKELAEKMSKTHPTLQQNFMRLCVGFIVRMSQKPFYDDRNKVSVELAKKMVEAIKDEGSYIPHI